MPKYKVKLEDGRTARITTESPVESNEQMQQIIAQQIGGGSDKPPQATSDQYLSTGERFSGGFRSPQDLEQVREQQRAERGLAPGTPLEPVGFNVQNALDIPNDIVDLVGPAFPALGQIFGGVAGGALSIPSTGGAAAPMAIAAGGVAGSAGGEFLRQEIGRILFGYDQGTMLDRTKRVGTEAAFAATGEGAGVVLGKAIQATKTGILQASKKALNKRGVDGLMKVIGKIAPDIDPQKTQFALDALRAGDKRVLSQTFSDEKFALKFGEKVLFGGEKGKLATNMAKLGRFSKDPDSVKALYKEFMNVPGETVDRIIKMGKANMGMVDDVLANEQYINTLSRRTTSKLQRAKDLEIERFGSQLSKSMEKHGNRTVDLGDINQNFIDNLKKIGVIDEFGSFNDDFANTKIKGLAKSILDDFTGTGDIKSLSGNKLKDALVKRGFSEKDALDALLKGKGGVAMVSAKKSMKLSDAYGKWMDFKRTLPKNFFESTPSKLSFPFASYFDDVSTKLGSMADMSTMNQRYGAFMSKYRQLENVFSDKTKFNGFLRQIDDVSIANSDLRGFERMLPKNLRFVDDVLDYNAVQSLNKFNDSVLRKNSVKRIESYMDRVFSDSMKATDDMVRNVIDNGLPKELRLSTKARIHSTAKALNSSAISLLRARFLAGGLGVSALLGGAGIVGSIGVVGAGLVLQDPRLFKILVRTTALKTKLPEKIVAQQIQQTLQRASSGVSKQVIPSNILSNLLRAGSNQGGM